ncbi:DUF1735 domain-containing protein [Chitinophaga sp. SYP-B3965]|uniref:DUF1735 domain-containing protein n=1 Tax=Chitinophaga sp. SYP-B3965 TaxID=2663120 RepID=UPI0012997BE7|nr:DUF1735 domain-containing protein [Chitinophaga sp. SYP-B3965]MRG45477.1 DUF1735 domain-containing protein [Chitinophaga sp. SYP-B3965]
MKHIISAFILLFLLSGCLKNEVVLDYSGIQPVVLVPNSNWPPRGFGAGPLTDSVKGTTLLNLYAKVSYVNALNKNVQVKFAPDNALIAAYNTQWGTDYKLLPDSCYTVSSLDLTIPAETKQAFLPITLIPSKINPQYDYILAYSITQADGLTVASNFKSMLFTLKGQ